MISSNPLRHRSLIPVAILEKAGSVLPCFGLFVQGRLPNPILIFALLDLVYGLCFVAAYLAIRGQTLPEIAKKASSGLPQSNS